MKQTDFELKVLRQHWILDDGKDDKSDLCSHGEVYIKIGSEELSNKESGSWSLSTAGLFLLRSLYQDCQIEEFSNQLVPCCGHCIYPDTGNEKSVIIPGCGSGVDWKISHQNSTVALESQNGSKAKLSFDEYKRTVLQFINEVEDFYGNPEDKIVPEDEFEKDGFNQFWAEWKALKVRANVTLDFDQTSRGT